MKKKSYIGLISLVIIVVSFFATVLVVHAAPSSTKDPNVVNCCDQWGQYRTNIARNYCQAIGRVVSSKAECNGSKKTPTTTTSTSTSTSTTTSTPTKPPQTYPSIDITTGWRDAQGYKMTIIKYDYTTKSEEHLASILIYSSALVQDIQIDLTGPIPTNINELGLDGVYLTGSQGITTSCSNQAAIKDASSKSPASGKMGYNITTDEYATSYRKVTYRGQDIIYEDYYVNSFLEENVSPTTIDSLVDKYARKKESVLTNFGVYIAPEEADMYYVSVEPVQRLVDKDKDNLYIYDSYVHHEFTHMYKDSDAWNENSWTSTKHTGATKCDPVWKSKEYNSGGCSTCACLGKLKGQSWTNCPANAQAGWYSNDCCAYSCKKDPDYYTYDLAAQKCGTKTRYLFYGYKGYGTSRIVTARAMHLGLTYAGYDPASTDSEHLSRAQNVKENNAHCVLDRNDICTNVYEYYVGPDLPKALVGTVSSNKFHFVDVSGYEGIKHYYWIDIPEVPECLDVCQEVGDRNTDAYLMCAEHYCEALVNYDLEGSQRERKKTCLLENCRYVYGKEPDTGAEPFNFPTTKYHSESVNSCSNSDPFAIYKGRELLGNTSTCNKDDSSGMEMQYVPGYFEECTSDQITDYDGNKTNDTAFDFRTYIVKACLESTALEYPNLQGVIFDRGEGIAYTVQQASNRQCYYYMNLEQWKFDYASISEKDTARKKRLKYIYDTFNNSLNEGYNGKNSPYYYSGEVDFVEEGYGVIDINHETYSEGKETVQSRVAEVVLNQQTESVTEKLNVIDYDKKDDKSIYFTGDTLTLVENNTISYISEVNRFMNSSVYIATYAFDKECLTTEGKSEIYKADSTGTCYKLVKGSTLEPYQGSNVHYTSLDATANKDFTTGGHHGFTTTGLVIKDQTGALYYQNTETCDYSIDSDDGRCEVVFTKDANGTYNIEIVENTDRLAGETLSYSLKVYRQDGENKTLVYEGAGKNHTYTPDDDKATYYMDAVMTSSVYGETYCSNGTMKKRLVDLDCTQLFKPVDLVNINNWCVENWQNDKHHYKSANACVTHCSKGCPDDCLNREALENFCDTNYENLGTDSKAQCVNYCYCAAEGDFVFRPISNIEPFPDRTAGPNWVGLEEIITQDDDDISSITGVNANQTVEYVIDFTSSTIRSIRSDTDKLNAEGNSPYTDLIYKNNTNPTKCKIVGGQKVCETGEVSEYRSKFIHDSDTLNGGFSSIFVNGSLKSGGKTVAIEYTPGNDFTNK